MTAILHERLCEQVVPSFRSDGSLADLAAPDPMEIDFCEVAANLSKIARYNGSPECAAFSVAQHSVMGTEALLNAGTDEVTAALFLLHDAHEYRIGDQVRPMSDLITAMLNEARPGLGEIYRRIIADIKRGWDMAIYRAAELPTPDSWTNRQRHTVEATDARMMAMEAEALFGRNTRKVFPLKSYPKLKTRGSIKPWGAAKAEMAFLDLFERLCGAERLVFARAQHAARRATAEI